jgi:integrase
MGSRYSMTTLKPAKSGAFKARKRLPADVRSEYQALYGPAWEVKLHIPAGTPWDKAKAEHAAWLAQVEGRIAALRACKGGKGVDLTQRQADALAGDWYRWFTSQHLDNPGSPKRWPSLRETLLEIAGDLETGELDFDQPEVLRAIETEARASQFLIDRGIALTEAGWTSFLSAVASEFLEATQTLERRARGDWSEDKHLDQLAPPPNLSPLATSPSPLNGQRSEAVVGGRTGRVQRPSAVALFEEYCKDRHLKPSTVDGQRCVFTALDQENWWTPDWDAQKWLDDLGTSRRKPQTVRNKWLAPARALFNWVIRKRQKDANGRRLVETNPFKDCSVTVPKKPSLRETGRAFNDDEIQIILCASTALGTPMEPRSATKRWVPWLCAYTGARVGEITQLRAQDIQQRACGPVLCLTPDAGTTKTGDARWVPLHLHLVEMGFPNYVAAVKAGFGAEWPLFYRPQTTSSRKHPAVSVREQLGKWIRRLGITDPDVQPNHGWRHTFRTRASRAGVEKRIRDEICGHAPETVADGYEHPTVEDMAVALKRFPRYEVK